MENQCGSALICYFIRYEPLGDLKHFLNFNLTLNSNKKNPTQCLENKKRMKTNFIGCTSQKNCTDDNKQNGLDACVFGLGIGTSGNIVGLR